MLKYGTDKPDLRNPMEIFDVTEIMKRDDVKLDIFKKLISKKVQLLRAIPAPKYIVQNQGVFSMNLTIGLKRKAQRDWHI